MHPFVKGIQKSFQIHANPELAVGMKAYMLHQFEFLGIKAPLRDQLTNSYLKLNRLENWESLELVVKELWALPQREFQYFAIDVFQKHKSLWTVNSVDLMEYCISEKSWWDSVDGIASEWLGTYFIQFPRLVPKIPNKWNKSDNMWLQRSSILFQKAYKVNTNQELLTKYILHCKDSQEFFIRKAIGWALREYSKTNPVWVSQFVAKNTLSNLSVREALKRINKLS
jgi:3-methyladenine DNA glycosylase AlkD